MSAVRTALVIGGGIAGPVTALALHRAGIEATVFEAYESGAEGVGGVFMVAPNGLAALRIVGLDEQVAAVGQPIRRMVIDDPRGRRMAEFGGVPGLPPGLALRRPDLYRLLLERLREAGVPVVHGRRLVGVEERIDGVTARFADGSTASADVLIGADGVRSAVRGLIDPDAPAPRNVGLIGLGGYSDHPGPGRPDHAAMHFANGRRAFFGWWTVPEGGTAWFSNLPHRATLTAAEAAATSAEQWLARLRDQHAGDVPAEQVLALARPETLVNVGSMHIMPKVAHWHRDRMVLVGDAAHAPSPSSGQGASLAIESAVELARCLRDLPDAPSAFAAYEGLRRDRVERIIAQAEKTNNEKAAGPVARTAMRLVAPIALRTFLRPEKMFGPVHGHRIDWEAPVTAP
ncbi:FAD-dependent monooxygenase [Kitasatospora paracochleata]|uniref:2-polyprenyl-6-methoxyphenol hydroxylase-like FAD-dependent oxidoreductase n=1 Tax=Kitasatospora paracochleata TaxID=58354 RepID=A0ABT1ISE8_9ACTN|nr:FAD-dependent monooxygenase [Kitasatospora paracochleata]MCP2308057.1 2-polyprenyl-6-methoxyphenol hydroxylase-like FAD-dependent oxidoreductase [Kitasatospora paracochleata]